MADEECRKREHTILGTESGFHGYGGAVLWITVSVDHIANSSCSYKGCYSVAGTSKPEQESVDRCSSTIPTARDGYFGILDSVNWNKLFGADWIVADILMYYCQ